MGVLADGWPRADGRPDPPFPAVRPSFIPDQRQVAYGAIRYTNETNRLYGVLDTRLKGRDFICGQLSIADFACWPWVVPHRNQGIQMAEFPHLKAWFERLRAREAVQTGFKVAVEQRGGGLQAQGREAEQARAVLFGQRARR